MTRDSFVQSIVIDAPVMGRFFELFFLSFFSRSTDDLESIDEAIDARRGALFMSFFHARMTTEIDR